MCLHIGRAPEESKKLRDMFENKDIGMFEDQITGMFEETPIKNWKPPVRICNDPSWSASGGAKLTPHTPLTEQRKNGLRSSQ